MKIAALIFLFAVLVNFPACSAGSAYKTQRPIPTTSTGLQMAIDSVLNDSLLASCFIGVKIISPDDGTVLYERNSNKLFHPASNMKLLTTSTALTELGDSFVFRTRFSTDGTIHDSVLHGNLYIKGAGDPLVKSEQLDSVAEQLHRMGIKIISGDLIGDVSYFDTLYWGSGWMWDDEPSTDAAFLTPLTVNSNSITIVAKPGRNVGDPVELQLQPKTRYVTFVNNGITSADTSLPLFDVTRVKGQNAIFASGRIAPNSKEQELGVSIWEPEFYFLYLYKEKLADHAVSLLGTMRLDTARGALPLAEIIHPLDSVLHQINKPSDNLAAENLLKTLAAERYHVPGTASKGLSIVKLYLTSIGIDTTKMLLADGSGLSWYNAISPDALTQLLLDQYRRTSTFRRFYESLPIAGVDGTLKNRMRGTRAAGNVHAKTGSLTGVSSLSGYVTTADGRVLIFSILCNHFPADITALRNAQNKIMELLASYRLWK